VNKWKWHRPFARRTEIFDQIRWCLFLLCHKLSLLEESNYQRKVGEYLATGVPMTAFSSFAYFRPFCHFESVAFFMLKVGLTFVTYASEHEHETRSLLLCLFRVSGVLLNGNMRSQQVPDLYGPDAKSL
jgi:hypothetical protein